MRIESNNWLNPWQWPEPQQELHQMQLEFPQAPEPEPEKVVLPFPLPAAWKPVGAAGPLSGTPTPPNEPPPVSAGSSIAGALIGQSWQKQSPASSEKRAAVGSPGGGAASAVDAPKEKELGSGLPTMGSPIKMRGGSHAPHALKSVTKLPQLPTESRREPKESKKEKKEPAAKEKTKEKERDNKERQMRASSSMPNIGTMSVGPTSSSPQLRERQGGGAAARAASLTRDYRDFVGESPVHGHSKHRRRHREMLPEYGFIGNRRYMGLEYGGVRRSEKNWAAAPAKTNTAAPFEAPALFVGSPPPAVAGSGRTNSPLSAQYRASLTGATVGSSRTIPAPFRKQLMMVAKVFELGDHVFRHASGFGSAQAMMFGVHAISEFSPLGVTSLVY